MKSISIPIYVKNDFMIKLDVMTSKEQPKVYAYCDGDVMSENTDVLCVTKSVSSVSPEFIYNGVVHTLIHNGIPLSVQNDPAIAVDTCSKTQKKPECYGGNVFT